MECKQRKTKSLNRRQLLKYGLYSGLSTGLSGSFWLNGCRRQREDKRPNIVLIVVDTLRADHVGCYGYLRNTTPNIDRFAQDGILFSNAISAAPWTLPSIATMLTSQYPCVLGIRDTAVINDRFPLLSQVLNRHNYTTYGIVSHLLVSARLGFGRGFDEYREWRSAQPVHRGISSPIVTREAISFLQRDHRKPFFLFAHYFDPHYDYFLHERYNYCPSYKGAIKSGQPFLEISRKRYDLSEDDLKYLVSLYDSEISFTDEYVGRVLDELKRQGYYDNSIIIVTSDHGEEFMEKGWIGHAVNLYQELLHIPLIIKLPGGEARTIDSLVGLIDIVPTIYKYLDLPIFDGLEGKPLELSMDSSVTARPIFSETFKQQDDRPELAGKPITFRSVIFGGWKLIYDQMKDLKQIYNLSEDPHERNDLAANKNTHIMKLESLLSQWLKNVESKSKPAKGPSEKELFTPEQRKQLESLGYI